MSYRFSRRSFFAATGAAVGLHTLLQNMEARAQGATTPPRRLRGNPTGAGDSVVAGLLSGLVDRLPWPARLSRAVALSAATVLAPVAGEFDRQTYEELVGQVAVTGEVTAA